MLKSCLENKGIFLLELVVAIAILSVGITLIIQAFSYSARAHALSGDMIEAVFLAQDTLQKLEFNERRGIIKLEPFEGNGTRGQFEWGYNLVPVQDTKLYLLTLSVNWKRLKRTQDLTACTYLR